MEKLEKLEKLKTSVKFLLNTIYMATEGEGIRLGWPQIFVRFQGCNIGCVNCDSKETWDFKSIGPYFELTLDQVLEKIHLLSQNKFGTVKRVSITGGDPLHPAHEPAVMMLVSALKSEGYFINLEAAGTRIVPVIFEQVDFISIDYKTPSTGVVTRTQGLIQLAQKFPGKFQVKSVIEDRADFDYTLAAYREMEAALYTSLFDWCLTPAYTPGKPFSLDRVKEIFQWNIECGGPFRVIGQQHKWFYGADDKEV